MQRGHLKMNSPVSLGRKLLSPRASQENPHHLETAIAARGVQRRLSLAIAGVGVGARGY